MTIAPSAGIGSLGQHLLDGVDVGVVVTDEQARITFANRHAAAILRTDDSILGLDVRALLGLDGDLEALVVQTRGDRHPHVVGDVEVDLAVNSTDSGAGSHAGFVFTLYDRTHEKQLVTARLRLERLAAMGTMVAGFAHEVRNPMASLRSIAESLKDELDEAEVALPHVDWMLKVLERVERLVRTSLLFGRPTPPRATAHSTRAILSNAIESMQTRTRPLGSEILVEASPDLPDVFVDDGQLAQVLVILLNNAVDATGSPKQVLLRATGPAPLTETHALGAEPTLKFVRFDVRDDGPGIAPDILGRVFDPFFTTKASGTGLGLSIAQQLLTENGARIELTSSVGGPTVFSVFVPVTGDERVPLSLR